MERSIAYSKERKAFGTEIKNHQIIQFKLPIWQQGLMQQDCFVLEQRGKKITDKDYTESAAMAKVFASETAMWATTEAVQIHGGYGYVKEYHVERMMRDAKITQIYEGTSEVQRIVISRAILK